MAMKLVFAKANSVENNAVSFILAAGNVKVDATIVGTFKDTDVNTPDTDSVAASIKTCYEILDVLEPGLSLADITASPPTAVLLPAGSNEGTSVDAQVVAPMDPQESNGFVHKCPIVCCECRSASSGESWQLDRC